MISINCRCLLSLAFMAALIGSAFSPVALGLTVPFTEDFTAGSAQWFTDSTGTTPPSHQLSGGPDDGAHVSRTFDFANTTSASTPILFRGQAAFGSSDNAFVGNWIDGGVTELSAWVRHDAPANLVLFARLAPAGNAGVIGLTGLIPSGQWTQITFPIMSSAFINEGPPGSTFFNGVLSNIGNVQFGTLPGSMAGVDQVVNFDIDQVRIVPEPATLLLLCTGGLLMARRGRKGLQS